MGQKLSLLLREVKDPYVQENFRKLKYFIEELSSANNDLLKNLNSPETMNIRQMSCPAGAAEGDLVYIDYSKTNFARTYASNTPPSRFIGVIVKKINATRVDVQMYGIIETNLPTGPVFAGEDGKMRIGIPNTGITQKLGFSFGNGFMLLSPNRNRIKIN